MPFGGKRRYTTWSMEATPSGFTTINDTYLVVPPSISQRSGPRSAYSCGQMWVIDSSLLVTWVIPISVAAARSRSALFKEVLNTTVRTRMRRLYECDGQGGGGAGG